MCSDVAFCPGSPAPSRGQQTSSVNISQDPHTLFSPPQKINMSWEPPTTIEALYAAAGTNRFSAINRPTAGARSDEALPVGKAPFQLYSLATPNGQKVGILLEELGIKYDAHTIPIIEGAQFSAGFVKVNPNSKIPCATDKLPTGHSLRLFETGSILVYLADKYGNFLPSNATADGICRRAECLNWVNWAQVQAFVTGNYGHFFVYAPDEAVGARTYGVARYGMEVQRLCSVLDQHLEGREYICGKEYTIADMAVFPWFELLRTVGYVHQSGVKTSAFLAMNQYKHVNRWADKVASRKGVKRGMLVCRKRSFPKPWLNPDDTRFHHLQTKSEAAKFRSRSSL